MKHLSGFGTPFTLGIYGKDSKSYCLGSVMFDKVSWTGVEVDGFTNDSAELRYSIRSAVGPGRQVVLRFVLGVVRNRYGKEENGIQALYDSFPEQWTPFVGKDNPYIWKTHGEYCMWTYRPRHEVGRRHHMGWDWAYAPYKRSGDIFGHPELWDYKPLAREFNLGYINKIVGGEFGPFDWRNLSVEEFHENRRKVFHKYGRKYGFAFYPAASGTWCELALAREKYPDAISYDTDGVVCIHRNGWTNNHDQDIRVFQMGTSFGTQFRKDLKLVYEELNLPGFSFDCAGCGAYYRGPATKNYDLPGRAWDDKGLYIDSSVGTLSILDYVRQELAPPNTPASRRPFVAGNGSINCDVVMLECTTFSPTFHNLMPQWKYVFGSLPGVIHGKGYLILETIPDWNSLTREQFLQRFTSLAVYETFTEFRYGLSSARQLYIGNALAQYSLPELLECIREGWQAVNPVDCDNGGQVLYQARYGRGSNSILFYGNPYEQPQKVKMAVSNDLLGDETYLFIRKMRDEASLKNCVRKGRTCFDYEFPARIPILFEAVCGFRSLPDVDAEVSSQKDVDHLCFTIQLHNSEEFKSMITPRQLDAWESPRIFLNGKLVSAQESLVFPPNSTLTIEAFSKMFKTSAKSILSFPFLGADNKPGFAIRMRPGADQEELKVAENVREYFRFCAQVGLCAAGEVPIVAESQEDKPCLILSCREQDATQHGISCKGRNLVVTGGDCEQTDELVRQLAYVMDRRFEYWFGIGGIDGFPHNIINHFKIEGTTVPVQMTYCFESKERTR